MTKVVHAPPFLGLETLAKWPWHGDWNARAGERTAGGWLGALVQLPMVYS